MVTVAAVVPPDVGVKNVDPAELLESRSETGGPLFVTALPNWSSTLTWNGPTFAVVPTVWLPLTVDVYTSWLGGAGVTVNEVAAEVTPVWVVSVAVIVYEPGVLI
jgi:hypothetical protein